MQSTGSRDGALYEQVIRREARILNKNPIREKYIEELCLAGTPETEVLRVLIHTHAFVMQFTDFESRGALRYVFDTEFFDVQGVLGFFDKTTSSIKYHHTNAQDVNVITIIKNALDEKAITESLAEAYDDYSIKLCFLATHYYHSYKNFSLLVGELKKLDPHCQYPTLPVLPENYSVEMLKKIDTITKLQKETGEEPTTTAWEKKLAQISSVTVKEVVSIIKFPTGMKKYFNAEYHFPSANLHELHTAACFIQETIAYVASQHITESLSKQPDHHKALWSRYVSIQAKILSDTVDPTTKNLTFNVDYDNPRHLKDESILMKLIVPDALAECLSPSVINLQADKKAYFQQLFDEVESFFVSINHRDILNAIKNINPIVKSIYTCDFALEFTRPIVMQQAIVNIGNDNNKRDAFHAEITVEVSALMAYAMIQSGNRIHTITHGQPHNYVWGENTDLEKIRKKYFQKGYFDLPKIETEFGRLTTQEDKLFFLANVYLSAKVIGDNLRTKSQNTFDTTDWRKVRNAIAEITTKEAADEKCAAVNQQKAKRSPMTGLEYKHCDPIKKNSVAIIRSNTNSQKEILNILTKVYAAILRFCDYESHGLVSTILDIKMPKLRVILGTFDKENSKIKWHPEDLDEIQDELILNMFFEESAINVPFAKVYDSYEHKLYYLSMLFYQTYISYKEFRTKLQNLNPLVIIPYLPDFDISVLTKMMDNIAGLRSKQIATGREPSTNEWEITHARITVQFGIIPLSLVPEEKQNDNEFVNKTVSKYLHYPYFQGSELNEFVQNLCFIQETIYLVSKKYLTEDLLKDTALSDKENFWRRYISIKCEFGQDGQLTLNVDNNNHKAVREASVIVKHVKLNLLNQHLSPAFIEKQNDIQAYFKKLFDELDAAIPSNNKAEKWAPGPELVSDFVIGYLDPKITYKLITGIEDLEFRKTLFERLIRNVGNLMVYANTESNDRMIEIVDFEPNLVIFGKPLQSIELLKSLEKDHFNFKKLSEDYKAVTHPAHRYEFLATLYINAAMFVFRLCSPLKLIVDRVDYKKMRNQILKVSPTRNNPSYFGMANDLIGTQINVLFQAQAQRRPALVGTKKTKKSDAKKTSITDEKKEEKNRAEEAKRERREKKAQVKALALAQAQAEAQLQDNQTPSINTTTSAEPPVNPKLKICKDDYNTTKTQFSFLNLKLETLQDELKDLVKQLRQMLEMDNKERKHDLRPCRASVNELENEFYTKIQIVNTKIHSDLSEIKPEDEAKLTENQTLISDIKNKIQTLESQQEKLLAAVHDETLKLDHIIPKNTLKKAQESYLEAQRLKVKLAREQEEEKIRLLKAKVKIERPRSKPSSQPVQTLSASHKKLSLSAKMEKKEQKISRPDPRANERLIHLDEAVKNLILIRKMLAFYRTELSAEVIHYALLYNIFRCFQSLKMYQEKGGQQRSINPDEVANLRNMIMHHGAGSAHPEAVEAFAEEMEARLPQQLLKLTHQSLSGFELQKTQRQELMAEFNLLEPSLRFSGFLDHSKLVLDDTPLYKKLVEFHEQKIDNNDNANICEQVLGIYIPLIRTMMTPLVKATSHESEMKPEHLLETFGFQLQALRLLISICGEFEPHITPLTKDKSLISFLNFCRQDIRNPMGHKAIDTLEPEIFINTLKRYLSNIDEKSQLTKLKRNISTTPIASSHTLFGSRGAGSAMDTKYDKPQVHKSTNLKK